MKTTQKNTKKFNLKTFEVAKIKNLKVIKGGNEIMNDQTINPTKTSKNCAPETIGI